MRNGKENRRALAVTAVTVLMIIAATTTSMATTGISFASSTNQATASANDCGNGQMPTNVGCQNLGSQIQGDGNSVALAAQQTFPPAATGFTVTGSGTGGSEDLSCPHPVTPGQAFSVDFSAESDGTTTSGTYTISVIDSSGEPFVIREGVFTFADTDGSTFTLFGVENIGFCSDAEGNLPMDVAVAITGDCGDNVAILYTDANTFFPLTGNVECTLT